jgi:hypothetical protein
MWSGKNGRWFSRFRSRLPFYNFKKQFSRAREAWYCDTAILSKTARKIRFIRGFLLILIRTLIPRGQKLSVYVEPAVLKSAALRRWLLAFEMVEPDRMARPKDDRAKSGHQLPLDDGACAPPFWTAWNAF